MNQQNTNILHTKQHFQILDGLRGIAALAIVIFHFAEWVYLPQDNFISHGFLAVDFFFCLSGFVIAYAYDNRVGSMGIVEFLKRRLIRLHPLIVLGAVLGLLAFLFDPFSDSVSNYSLGQTITLFLCTVFLIPYPVMEERGFNLFGLNAPTWSLFWEYVANIAYVLVLYRLSRHYVLLLTIIAAILLGFVSYHAGNLLGGWTGENFWHGGARILFSFLAGLCIFRYQLIIKNKIGFIGLSCLLLLAFLMPQVGWNWLTELLVILIFFPLIVSLGAGTTLSPKFDKLCVFSGNISYPLYMTHYAVMWIFGNYFLTFKPNTTELTFIIIIGTILLVGFAYLVMVVYDIPVRRYLSRKAQKG
jgi:peptidoglycan/LPS O-acetylase OafA/YrhL